MGIRVRRSYDPMKDRWYYAAPGRALSRLGMDVLLDALRCHCFRPIKAFNGYWIFTSDPRHGVERRQGAGRSWRHDWERLGVHFLSRSQALWEVEQAILAENERLGIRHTYDHGDEQPEAWWTRR